jgi:hypothetical protein
LSHDFLPIAVFSCYSTVWLKKALLIADCQAVNRRGRFWLGAWAAAQTGAARLARGKFLETPCFLFTKRKGSGVRPRRVRAAARNRAKPIDIKQLVGYSNAKPNGLGFRLFWRRRFPKIEAM